MLSVIAFLMILAIIPLASFLKNKKSAPKKVQNTGSQTTTQSAPTRQEERYIETPTQRRAREDVGFLRTAFVVMLIIIIILGYFILKNGSSESSKNENKQESKEITIGQSGEIYYFPPNGVIELTIGHNLTFYPKGGCIDIKPPKRKKIEDCPGVLHEKKLKSGTYYITRSEGSKAYAVELRRN